MGFFDLGIQEEKSFLSVVRHTVLEGPVTLARFSDPSVGEAGALGKYWMYASEVAEAVSSHQGDRLIRELRRRWAISRDWGTLQWAWVFHLPAGDTLNAYWGFAKFQPRISVRGQKQPEKATEKSYDGGSIQLVLNLGQENRKAINGPYRTVGLKASHLRDA